MTGGTVVVLGRTGRNFAAGMSGGVAYIYDYNESFREKCNMGMVELEKIDSNDEKLITEFLEKHSKYTGSLRARAILEDFAAKKKCFIKVIPTEYKNILLKKKVAVVEESGEGD